MTTKDVENNIPTKIIKKSNQDETFIDQNGDTITIYNTSSSGKITIGQGVTLESIKNSNLSEEEKELLLADMIYYQSITQEKPRQLREEEALDLIEKDLAEGIIE